MSISYVIFKRDPLYEDFLETLKEHMTITHKILHNTMGYDNLTIERLSFVDYKNSTFYSNFPFNKQICINNTSTVDKFGFGRFQGHFFDVIVRGKDNNPKNIRIFYGIIEEASQAIESKHKELPNKDTIFILGEERPIITIGRYKYVEVDNNIISVTAARKLEKTKQVHNKIIQQ